MNRHEFELHAARVRTAGQRWTLRRFLAEWRAMWPGATRRQRLAWPWRHQVVGVASRDFGPTPGAVLSRAPARLTTREEKHMAQKPNHAVGANGITAKEYADAVKDGMRTGGASKTEARRAAAKAHKSAVRGGARRK